MQAKPTAFGKRAVRGFPAAIEGRLAPEWIKMLQLSTLTHHKCATAFTRNARRCEGRYGNKPGERRKRRALWRRRREREGNPDRERCGEDAARRPTRAPGKYPHAALTDIQASAGRSMGHSALVTAPGKRHRAAGRGAPQVPSCGGMACDGASASPDRRAPFCPPALGAIFADATPGTGSRREWCDCWSIASSGDRYRSPGQRSAAGRVPAR